MGTAHHTPSANSDQETMAQAQPTQEEIEDLVLCARYGGEEELGDMQAFVERYGEHWLAQATDDRGNTCLHMASANGHANILSFLLPRLDSAALLALNGAGSSALHWAALNFQLGSLEALCACGQERLPDAAFTQTNARGLSALQDAQERCERFKVPVSTSTTTAGEGASTEAKEGDDDESPEAKERARREQVVDFLAQEMERRGVLRGASNDKDGQAADEMRRKAEAKARDLEQASGERIEERVAAVKLE